MTVRVYRSTDVGAPVLTGEVGSIVTLLNDCLVDGYSTYTPAGWVREYTGTNEIVFKEFNGKMFLRVDDTGSTAANKSRLSCFRSMSDVSTGSKPAIVPPCNSSVSSSVILFKSATANSTARPWIVIADEKTIHVFVDQSSSGKYTVFSFGEYYSYIPENDQNIIISGVATSGGAATDGGIGMRNLPKLGLTLVIGTYTTGWASPTYGYSSRFDGVGCPLDIVGDMTRVGNVTAVYPIGAFTPAITYPDLANGAIRVGRLLIAEDSDIFVGEVRGLYEPLHKFLASDFNMNGTLVKPSSGSLSGKTLEFIALEGGGHILAETSNTWS